MVYRLVLLLILVASPCLAEMNPYKSGIQTVSATAYLIDEDFAGTTTPTGWTDTNSPDHSVDGQVSADMSARSKSPTFTAQSNVYAAIVVTIISLGNTGDMLFFYLRNSVDATVGSLKVRATDVMRMESGTNRCTSTLTITANTKYYMWFNWEKDPGSSTGDYGLRIGTTGTYADATSYCTGTNGAAATDVTAVEVAQYVNDTSDNIIFEQVIVSTSSIGNI